MVLATAACNSLEATEPEPTAIPPVVESPSPVRETEHSPEVTPTPSVSRTPTAEPTVEPDPSEAQREAELERLRATNFFVEFAEADRARNATWARFAYDHFKVYDDEQVLFEWANKDELWDTIAPKVRDECLLAGRPATRPMWDAQIVIPASLNPTWNNNDTVGRGHFVDFVCVYQDEHGGLVEMWIGALIAESDRRGEPAAVSTPLHLHEEEHQDMGSAEAAAERQLWTWMLEQPVLEGD